MPKKAAKKTVNVPIMDPAKQWLDTENARKAWRNQLDSANVENERGKIRTQPILPTEVGLRVMHRLLADPDLTDEQVRAVVNSVKGNREQRSELGKWLHAVKMNITDRPDVNEWFSTAILDREIDREEWWRENGKSLDQLITLEENLYQSHAPPEAPVSTVDEFFTSDLFSIFSINKEGVLIPTTFHPGAYTHQFEWIRAGDLNDNMRAFLGLQANESELRSTLLLNHQLSDEQQSIVDASSPEVLFADDALDESVRLFGEFSDHDKATGRLRDRVVLLNGRDPWNRLFLNLLHLLDRSDLLSLQQTGCANASALECLLNYIRNDVRLARRYESYMFDVPGQQQQATLLTYYGNVDALLRWLHVDQRLRARGDLLIRLGSRLDLESSTVPFHLRTIRMMDRYREIVSRLQLVLEMMFSRSTNLVLSMLACFVDVTPVDVVRKLTLLQWATVNLKEVDPQTLVGWMCQPVEQVENEHELLLDETYLDAVMKRFGSVFPDGQWPENYREWMRDHRDMLERKVSKLCPEVFSMLPIDTYLFGWALENELAYVNKPRFTTYLLSTFGPVNQVSSTDFKDWLKRVNDKKDEVQQQYDSISIHASSEEVIRPHREQEEIAQRWGQWVLIALLHQLGKEMTVQDIMKTLTSNERISIYESLGNQTKAKSKEEPMELTEETATAFARDVLERKKINPSSLEDGWQALFRALQTSSPKQQNGMDGKDGKDEKKDSQDDKDGKDKPVQVQPQVYQDVLNWLTSLEQEKPPSQPSQPVPPPSQEFGRKRYAFSEPIHRLIQKMSLTR